ncbi:MAG: N(5)-(carboxyethyl)ornithine synthase [Clostridiaceae bacterium]
MNVAVIGTSRKENEKRVPIHPEHIKFIPENLRNQLFFEKEYGMPFGITDEEITSWTGNPLMDRKTLFHNFKAMIVPKPVEEDFKEMQEGTIVWGWIHSVQQNNIAQIAIDKKLTLIAWENMYSLGERSRIHIFQKNNEMAGYCGVQHALQLRGIDGNFGVPKKCVILSFGSVSRGAVYALKGHGFQDITILTQRASHLVLDKIPGIKYKQIFKDKSGGLKVKSTGYESKFIIDELTEADIIVNGVLQKPNNPITFIRDDDIIKFKKECLIIDISCDKGMGFSFADPTDFSQPLRKIGNILYYAVDHTPSLLWDSASWEISNSLIPYLSDFVEQRDNPVINDAVDVKDGIILNEDILFFQNRSAKYPYESLDIINQNEKAHEQINYKNSYPIEKENYI